MSAILIGLFTGMILSGSLFVLPEFLRNVSAHTYSATQTGQIICVYALTAAAVRPLMVPLIAHIGQRKTIVLALSMLIASMLIFQHFLTTDTPTVYYVLPLVLYGLCLSPLLPAVGSGTVAQIAQDKLLDGVSLYMTFRQFGASLGVAFLTILLEHRETPAFVASVRAPSWPGWRAPCRSLAARSANAMAHGYSSIDSQRPGIGTARRGRQAAGRDLELCRRVLVHGADRGRSSLSRPHHSAYARWSANEYAEPDAAATSGRARFYRGQRSELSMRLRPLPASRLPMIVGAVALVALIVIAAYFVVPGWYSESTDDAYVTAHLTTVTAKVPAYVQTLHIDDNAAVKAGELLVELDPRDYAVDVEIARANLEAAARQAQGSRRSGRYRGRRCGPGAGRTRGRTRQCDARGGELEAAAFGVRCARHIERTARYGRGGGRCHPGNRYGGADQSALRRWPRQNSLDAQVKTAAAALAQAQAALDQAQLNLSYTKITAVETGTIANKLVEDGNYVQPGQTLFSIVPVAPYVMANFKETQLERMRPGQAAQVRVDAYPHLRLKGHVDSLQRGTGSVFALLPPENATGQLREGRAASARQDRVRRSRGGDQVDFARDVGRGRSHGREVVP